MNPAAVSRHLVTAVRHPDGTVTPTPWIVELDPAGRVVAHTPLTGHEPPATTILYHHLLDLTLLQLEISN